MFYVRDDGGKFSTFTSQDIYENTWRQITWVNQNITNHSTALFIDGQPVAWTGNGLIPGIPQFFSTAVGQSFVIGAENNRGTINSFANAEIDEVRIFDRALSAAEVSLLYHLERPGAALTDANFKAAIALWFSDEANATATYGHISNWDVSAVTDMSRTFWYKSSFNEDISRWDVSAVTDMRNVFVAGALINPLVIGTYPP